MINIAIKEENLKEALNLFKEALKQELQNEGKITTNIFSILAGSKNETNSNTTFKRNGIKINFSDLFKDDTALEAIQELVKTTQENSWVNVKEASKILGVHPDTLGRYVRFGLVKTDGDKPVYRDGWHIKRSEIERVKSDPDWLKKFRNYIKQKPIPVKENILSKKREEIIKEIEDLYKHGESLNPMYVIKHRKGLLQRARRYFGSYRKAILSTQVRPNDIYLKLGRKNASETYESKSFAKADEQKRSILLDKIKNLIKSGRLDYKTKRKLDGMVCGYLGGWENVYRLPEIRQLLLEERQSKLGKIEKDIIFRIQQLYSQGTPLYRTYMVKNYSTLFWQAVVHFKGYQNAIKEAGLDYSKIRKERKKAEFKFIFIEDFKKYLQYDRQYLKGTIESYLSKINQFQDFIKKNLDTATEDDIRNFLIFIKEKGFQEAYFIASLRSYYRWLTYKLKDSNLQTLTFFLTNIVKIKTKRKMLQVYLTAEDIAKLRKCLDYHKLCRSLSPDSHFYKKIIRDIAIFELLITTGLRSSELRNLHYSDIDLEKRIIFIKITKTGYPRESLFGETAYNALKEYFGFNNFSSNDTIFNMRQGNLLGYMIKRWIKKAGIDKNVYPHLFRHFFITEAQRRGVPVQSVAQQVGHKNLNSTFYYTHTDIESIRSDFQKCGT